MQGPKKGHTPRGCNVDSLPDANISDHDNISIQNKRRTKVAL